MPAQETTSNTYTYQVNEAPEVIEDDTINSSQCLDCMTQLIQSGCVLGKKIFPEQRVIAV